MWFNASTLQEILRFDIFEKKDRRSRSRVYSLQTNVYGKLLILIFAAALVLIGLGATQSLITLLKKIF